MDKNLPLAGLDEALPEIESNEVVLVADGDIGYESDEIDLEPRGVEAAETTEQVRRELEDLLAETRGELGARIAELEGELEALRESDDSRLREIDALQAELAEREPAPAAEAGGSKLVSMLHAELAESQSERERLAAAFAEVEADRERLQDELAGQIGNLAGQLAARDAEIAALQRKVQQLAQMGQQLQQERDQLLGSRDETPVAADADLATRAEDLEAENGFLQAEIDRLAAQLAAARR